MVNKHISKTDLANRDYLSELLDGDASTESIDKLLADETQGRAWFRYQTVSAVLKGEHSALSSYEFSQTVAAKIEQEPAIIAKPRSGNRLAGETKRDWRMFGGGFAVAASVAFAMVFSVQTMNSGSDMNPAEQFAETPRSPSGTPVVFSSEQTAAATEEQRKLEEIQRMLNRLNQNQRQYNEQLVGGEVMSRSFVVEIPEGWSNPDKVKTEAQAEETPQDQ